MYKRLALLGAALAAVLLLAGCAVYPGYGYDYYDGYYPDDYYDDYYYGGSYYWYMPGYYFYYPDYWYDHGRHRPRPRPPGYHEGNGRHDRDKGFRDFVRPPRGDTGTAKPGRPPRYFKGDNRKQPPKGSGNRIHIPKQDDDQDWNNGFRSIPGQSGRYGPGR